MIGELILIVIVGGTIGYLISKFKTMREDRKMLENIEEKMEKQEQKFFANGKELSIYEKEVKEVVAPIKSSRTKNKKATKKINNGKNKK